MTKEKNTLTSKELFELSKHVDGYSGQKFGTWMAAESYFSHLMQRKVTRPNITTAANNCNKTADDIVSTISHTPLSALAHSVRLLEQRIKALEELMMK